MIRCVKCGELKPKSKFGKDKRYKNGFNSYCYRCVYEVNIKLNRTKNGLINVIYNTQKGSSKTRKMKLPTYTLEEFKKWVLSQPKFDFLFDNWVMSDFEKDSRPSVDRIDDYKGYTMANIQLMTWKENNEKYKRDVKNKINTKTFRKVIQLDIKTGKTIKEFCSITEATKFGFDLGNIIKCCRGERKIHKGYAWAYSSS